MSSRELLRNGAQLAALWAVAVVQPLLEVLESGEVFVVADWRGGDVVLFALGFALLPPLLMLTFEAVAARIVPALAGPLHVGLVALLTAVLALYAVRSQTELGSEAALLIGAAAAAGAALLFRRFEGFRAFLAVLGSAALLFPALFLLSSPVRHLVLATDGAELEGPTPRAPVVMIVFDELPTLSLLDGRGDLDRRSYPAFARLARDGTWYRNATTVADFTPAATTAILTGRFQEGKRPASARAHPDNLLALLGERGGAEAHESPHTRLCPTDACAENRPRSFPGRVTKYLPALGKVSLATFLPDALYRRLPATAPLERETPASEMAWLARVRSRPARAMHFLHPHLPHQVWRFLPSGRSYPLSSTRFRDYLPQIPDVALATGLPTFTPQRWTADPERVIHMRQRHLAQVRYTDRLLGQVLDGLRASGLYERALIVVTADHGIAFRPDRDARRLAEATAPGIQAVPLFVKLPGQRRGATSDAPARSIDIAPTVADALGLRLPWRADGRSLLRPGPPPDRLVARGIETDTTLETRPDHFARRLRAEAAAQATLFAGSDPDRIFRTGRHRDLIGRRVDSVSRAPAAALHFRRLGDPAAFAYRPESQAAPALIGIGLAGPNATGREFLVALDGTVAASARSWQSGPGARFEVLVDENRLRPGAVALTVHEVLPGRGGPRLAEVPPAP